MAQISNENKKRSSKDKKTSRTSVRYSFKIISYSRVRWPIKFRNNIFVGKFVAVHEGAVNGLAVPVVPLWLESLLEYNFEVMYFTRFRSWLELLCYVWRTHCLSGDFKEQIVSQLVKLRPINGLWRQFLSSQQPDKSIYFEPNECNPCPPCPPITPLNDTF